jgi:hypothetical protein
MLPGDVDLRHKADKEHNPCTKRPIRDHHAGRKREEAEPLLFEGIDVRRLWRQAQGDTDLCSAILIGA